MPPSFADLIFSALWDIQSTRYAQLASSAIIVFDHCRIDLGPRLMGSVEEFLDDGEDSIRNWFFSPHLTDSFCLRFFQWQGWTGLIACMIAEVILQMRLYALYHLNKKVLALMIVSFVLASATSATVMGKVLFGITAVAHPLPGVTFCTPIGVPHWFYAFWIPMLASECLLCGLALVRGFCTFRESGGSVFTSGKDLISILIRDSVLYFLVIFATYFTNMLIWIFARQTLLEIPIGFSVAMSCVLANRVVFNIRAMNRELGLVKQTPSQKPVIYSDSHDMSFSSPVSPSFASPTADFLNEIEMDWLREIRADPELPFVVITLTLEISHILETNTRIRTGVSTILHRCLVLILRVVGMSDETSPLLGDSRNAPRPAHIENRSEPIETPQDSAGGDNENKRSTKFYLTLYCSHLAIRHNGILMKPLLLAQQPLLRYSQWRLNDLSLFAPAYAAIGSELKQLQNTSWIATAYLLTMTSFQPLYGKLSDIFGRKACLILAYSIFALGSLLCGLSRTMNELIAGRAIAGIGGGGMSTIVSIIISDVVPLRARGTWQGIINIIFSTGAAAGAPLGGFITDGIGWRWAFLIPVPVTLLAILAVSLALHLPKTTTSDFKTKIKRVDFGGALALVLAVFFLLFGLDRGGNISWQDHATIAALVAFVIMSVLFALVEMKYAREPFAPKRIIANGSLLGSYLTNFFGVAAGVSMVFHVSLYLQAVQGKTASQTSLWLVSSVAGGLAGSLAGGIMIQATGKFYKIILVSQIGLLAGTITMALVTGVLVQSQIGIGIGGGITTCLVALIANAGSADQAIATAVSYLFRSLGSVVGLSVGSMLIQSSLKSSLRRKLAGSDVDEIVRRVRESLTYVDQLDPATRAIVRGAYEQAIHVTFWFTAIMAACSVVSAIFIKEKPLVRK
ncbi:major facilitator superfamily-domain-containing protein [Infundibulicybe gibba]|nr:major facilitator superfamily-domain-containing protein [Infundibulicybe gibba]